MTTEYCVNVGRSVSCKTEIKGPGVTINVSDIAGADAEAVLKKLVSKQFVVTRSQYNKATKPPKVEEVEEPDKDPDPKDLKRDEKGK